MLKNFHWSTAVFSSSQVHVGSCQLFTTGRHFLFALENYPGTNVPGNLAAVLMSGSLVVLRTMVLSSAQE